MRASKYSTKVYEAHARFDKACKQVVLLNDKLHDLQHRYRKAEKRNQRNFRYSLRLRMAVVEGVRNMYFDYATIKANELNELRCKINGVPVTPMQNGPDEQEMV